MVKGNESKEWVYGLNLWIEYMDWVFGLSMKRLKEAFFMVWVYSFYEKYIKISKITFLGISKQIKMNGCASKWQITGAWEHNVQQVYKYHTLIVSSSKK